MMCLHKAIKACMRRRNPALRAWLPHEEIVRLMDRLSEKVIKGTSFANWREAMAFIRGKEIGDGNKRR